MRKFFIIAYFGIVSAFGLISCGIHDVLSDNYTSEAKMVKALQEALVLGSKTAALNLGDSSCTSNSAALGECATGYLGNKLVEIALPDTVERVLNQINSFTNKLEALPDFPLGILKNAVGESQYNSLLDLSGLKKSLKEALNKGAERAALNSVDIFKNAIVGMSFSDAKGVLLGDSVAATSYLKTTTYPGLQSTFKPIIKKPLDLLDPNQHWKSIASTYNSFASAYEKAISLPIVSSVLTLDDLPYNGLPTDLSETLTSWATGKALDGLFFMVGKQETQLREDPWGTVKAVGGLVTDTVGELLGDVFGSVKNGLI